MIKPTFWPSQSFILAAYPTAQLTVCKLFPVAWSVIKSLELNDLPVIAATADGASHN